MSAKSSRDARCNDWTMELDADQVWIGQSNMDVTQALVLAVSQIPDFVQTLERLVAAATDQNPAAHE